MKVIFEGIENARDPGGMKTIGGDTLRKGILLRTGKLENATERDIEKLKEEYSLRTIIDMRMSHERESHPNPGIEGVRDIHLPILDESRMMGVMSFDVKNDSGLPDDVFYSLKLYEATGADRMLYVHMIDNEVGEKGYKEFLRLLADNDKRRGIVWHCSYGKDRTGIGAALFLALLGVSREDILADFEQTNETYAGGIEQTEEYFSKHMDAGLAHDVALMARGVNPECMEKLFEFTDREYGSVRDFARERLDVDEDMLQTLRKLYLY